MGLTVILTVSFEIPIFQIAPKLLDRFGSGGLLLAGSTCYIIRAIGYSCIPKGHILYVLALEPLHGITYACSQTASVDTAAKSMPKGYEATGQSFMYFARGLGSCMGLWLGGKAMDNLGPRIMYRVSSLVTFVGSGIFALVLFWQRAPPEQIGLLLPTEDTDETQNPLECLQEEDLENELELQQFSDLT